MKIFIMKENKYRIGFIFLFLICWVILSNIVNKEMILPSPYKTFESVLHIMREESFVMILFATIKRSVIGLLIALILGMILGSLAGFFKTMDMLLNPIITFMKSAPTMGLIILALIWLGSEKSPIAIGLMVIFPIVYTNVYLGIKQMDKKLIEMGRLYQLSKKDMFFSIYLPSLKPYIKSSAIMGSGLNLKVIIAAEVISQPSLGIGTNFQIERMNLNTSGVFAWIFIVVAIVCVFDIIIGFLFYENNL